jgi:hypothetical protein
MVCFFCGSKAPKTREHALPRWLGLPLGGDVGIDTFLHGDPANLQRGPTVRRRRVDHVLRRVCGSCNNGWMSTLEQSVEALLTQLVAGSSVRLWTARQVELARWTVKTAATLSATSKEPNAIAQALRRQLAAGDDLSAHIVVSAACVADDRGTSPYWRIDCRPNGRDSPALSLMGIALGCVALEVACLNDPVALQPTLIPPLLPLTHKRLWPPTQPELWPTGHVEHAWGKERPLTVLATLRESGLVAA